MRKSIATVSVGGTLAEKLDAIAAARFAGIELFDADLTCSPLSAEDVAARCADLGLGIDLFQPLRDIVGMRPDAFADRIRFARAKFDVMERLGTRRVLVCSAVHPQAVPGPDLAAEQLARLGDAAAEHGVTVAFEALAWGSHINRLGQAWAAVAAAGHPAVGLAVDTFHLLARGDDASALASVPGDRIAYLQVADAPYLSMDVLEWSRHHRCFPGQGSMDVVGVVSAVLEAGYRGPLSLEVFSDIVREAAPQDTARDAMRSLLFLEEQLRRHWTTPDATPAAAHTRPSVELFDPPAEPAAPRVSSVEVAVAPGSSAVPDLLRALGFRPRAVIDGERTAWHHGAATVLVTTALDLDEQRPTEVPRPSVTALGMTVEDPDRFLARAEALQWNPSPLTAAGPIVVSPTGVRMLVDAPAAAAVGTVDGLALDHVGMAVDVDRSDAEVSFFRTLFGMRPGPVSEFFDPSGRLRSRVLAAPAGGPRVVHNIVVRAGGGAPQTGVNQVAYACADLLDRVEALRAAEAPLLRVPAGYYDDLSARLDLDPALLDRLRRLGVLYDRDDEGELLHAYTPLVGGRFYVEILERRGGYTGFGATNTPVRLAMQASADWIR